MAVVKAYGTPSLFVTMTARQDAPEVVACLRPGQVAADRWDLCSEVFEAHARQLLDDIMGRGGREGCFGDAAARFHSMDSKLSQGKLGTVGYSLSLLRASGS
eukprot:SAG11_NODE_2744_length_3019_cov_34.916096_2_plen_102_part_00